MSKEADAILQDGEVVGRAVGAEVDEANKKIRFEEICQSDFLLLPDECKFRQYRIQLQDVEYASKEGPETLQKGRILRNLTADIVGYCEQ